MLRYLSILVFFLLLGFQNLKGQNCESDQLMLQQITASLFSANYLQYDGTPFFDEKWEEGKLTLVSGEVYGGLNLKIDLFEDELIYFSSLLKKQLVIDKNTIQSFKLTSGDRHTEVINYRRTDSTAQVSEFYFVLLSDTISLWCKRKTEINLNTEFTSRYAKLGTFYSKEKYYYVENGELTRFQLRKRNILEHFPTIKKELSAIVRKNRYDIKNEQHLTQLFKDINALICSGSIDK